MFYMIKKVMNRLLVATILAVLILSCSGHSKKKPVILLRSGWQIENIGDIAHTPGFLALAEKYIPEAEVYFWPFYPHIPEEEIAMFKKKFPSLKVVYGTLSADGKASTPELADVIVAADIFINNSGPATLGWAEAMTFKKTTGKPYGVYGVTYGLYGVPEKEMLSGAAFVFFRDTVSMALARAEGVEAPIMGFAPDAAFATDLTNDAKAGEFLRANGLDEQQFICCIPKHRFTPNWLHEIKKRPFDTERHARNEAMKEHDHAPMVAAITEIARTTDLHVLIVHEDETEISIGKEWVYDKLPDDVKPRVVWHSSNWLPDEAISIYKRSVGLFSHEMHSPIFCIGHGIPAIVVRWEEQSSKGTMWETIGLGEWLFDFDNEEDVQRYLPTVLSMARNPEAAKAKAEAAKNFVEKKQEETMKVVRSFLYKSN